MQKSKKIVLVTGAHGFLGRNVTKFWALSGSYVVGIGHGSWEKCEWSKWGLSEWHSTEIDLKNLVSIGCYPDVIVHCAGSGSVAYSMMEPHLDYLRTVATMADVLEFIRTSSPGTKLIYPSSAAVYGSVSCMAVDERTALKPLSPYGVHKYMAEQLCRSYCASFGISAGIIRLFSIYGPGLRKQLLWDACNKFTVGQHTFGGTGLELRDWLHVTDATALIGKLYEKANPSCPVVCGGSGIATPVRDIVNQLGSEICGSDGVGVFGGQARLGDPDCLAASISLAESWGWKPTQNIRDGLIEYATWFKQQQL